MVIVVSNAYNNTPDRHRDDVSGWLGCAQLSMRQNGIYSLIVHLTNMDGLGCVEEGT